MYFVLRMHRGLQHLCKNNRKSKQRVKAQCQEPTVNPEPFPPRTVLRQTPLAVHWIERTRLGRTAPVKLFLPPRFRIQSSGGPSLPWQELAWPTLRCASAASGVRGLATPEP